MWDSLGDFILWLIQVAAWTVLGGIALIAVFWLTLAASALGMALWLRFTRWRSRHFPPDKGTWRDR